MITIKKITLVLLLFVATNVTAQQLYLEGGKSSTTFDFKSSTGVKLDNLQATAHSFMAIGYRNQVFTENLSLSIGANYSGYGAIGSNDALGNYLEWAVNYAGINVGVDYTVFNIKKASIYVKGGVSTAFFIQGSQTLNSRVIDLKNNEDFGTMLNLQVGAGFSHPISEHLSFYTQYLYGKSADMSKGDAELKIASSNVSFGLLINLAKK
jgi:hypothetical protein